MSNIKDKMSNIMDGYSIKIGNPTLNQIANYLVILTAKIVYENETKDVHEVVERVQQLLCTSFSEIITSHKEIS